VEIVEGLNMDKVYESLVAQIADKKLVVEPDADFKESIVDAQVKEKIKNEIAAIEAKIRKEKQFNIKLKLSTKLKDLKSNLSKI